MEMRYHIKETMKKELSRKNRSKVLNIRNLSPF